MKWMNRRRYGRRGGAGWKWTHYTLGTSDSYRMMMRKHRRRWLIIYRQWRIIAQEILFIIIIMIMIIIIRWRLTSIYSYFYFSLLAFLLPSLALWFLENKNVSSFFPTAQKRRYRQPARSHGFRFTTENRIDDTTQLWFDPYYRKKVKNA